jgi:hypothetical protein
MKEPLLKIIEKLNPDSVIDDIRICERATYATGERLGMAYNFRSGQARDRMTSDHFFPKLPAKAKEIAKLAVSKDIATASIGVAAINATIDIPENIKSINGKDIIFKRCAGRRVAMIGHFRFTDQLRKIAGHLDVLELRQSEGDLPASAAPEVLPKAEIVIITGTTLVNHTFGEIAELSQNSFSIILGPTSIMSPVFFDYGIDVVCGTRVREPSKVIDFLTRGGSFRDLKDGVEQLAIFQAS